MRRVFLTILAALFWLGASSTCLAQFNYPSTGLLDENGTAYGVKQTGNRPEVIVSGIPLPADAATATLQTAGNLILTAIDALLTTIDAALAGTLTVDLTDDAARLVGIVTCNAGTNLNTSALASEATAALINADTSGILLDTADILLDTASLDLKTPALGQALSAASVPFVQASDQPPTGTAIVSSDAIQDARWREPTATGDPPDPDQGTITVAEFTGPPAAPFVAKVYVVPTDKEFHDISLTGIVLDANAFQFTYQVFGMDVLPTVWTIEEYMSIGYLLVPAFTVARLSTTPTVPHSLVRSRAKYFVVVISSITVAPAQNKLVRIKSYNPGDELP